MLFAKLETKKFYFFSSFAPYREWKWLFASIVEKKFPFLLHIGTATGDFMTKSRNFFIFLLPHHICPANSCLLSSKRKKFIFPLSLHIGTAECRLLSWIVKKSRFPLSISYQYSKCPFASKIGKILKFLLSLHISPPTIQIMTFRKKISCDFSSQSKNTVRFLLYGGVYPVLYIRSFQFQ